MKCKTSTLGPRYVFMSQEPKYAKEATSKVIRTTKHGREEWTRNKVAFAGLGSSSTITYYRHVAPHFSIFINIKMFFTNPWPLNWHGFLLQSWHHRCLIQQQRTKLQENKVYIKFKHAGVDLLICWYAGGMFIFTAPVCKKEIRISVYNWSVYRKMCTWLYGRRVGIAWNFVLF